ncbi:hypothetical protein F5887DRAFT_922586 [Amanita rubescens]|nr:hypothetical protein F5887DRAFT_922586 [Amanita rubescens]
MSFSGFKFPPSALLRTQFPVIYQTARMTDTTGVSYHPSFSPGRRIHDCAPHQLYLVLLQYGLVLLDLGVWCLSEWVLAHMANLLNTLPPNIFDEKTDDAFDPAVVSVVAGGVIGCVVGGVFISALLFRFYTKRRPYPPPLTDSPILVQQVYQEALQKTYDPDGDIPTSSTIPRPRNEGPRGLLRNIIGIKLDNTMLISLSFE